MDHQSDAYTTLAAWLPRWCAMVVVAAAEHAGCDTQDLIGMLVLEHLRNDATYNEQEELRRAYDREIDEYKKIARVEDVTVDIVRPR